MIYCYPTIQGKKKKYSFYSAWDEVPFRCFLKWQPISIKLESLHSDLNEIGEKIKELASKFGMAAYSSQEIEEPEKLEREINKLSKKASNIEEDISMLEVEGISLFCDIPIEYLIEFDRSRPDGGLTDNHLQSYVARLYSLAVTPMPEESLSSFIFQSKTDKEIEEMQKLYNKKNFFTRLLPSGIKLKKEIRKAKATKYKIKDLWEQTTFANKELQDMATATMKQIDKGNFKGLLFLIALLSVEGNENKKAHKLSEGEKGSLYIESYRKEFIKIFRERQEIFTNSNAGLSTGTVIRIKNFFLPKSKR